MFSSSLQFQREEHRGLRRINRVGDAECAVGTKGVGLNRRPRGKLRGEIGAAEHHITRTVYTIGSAENNRSANSGYTGDCRGSLSHDPRHGYGTVDAHLGGVPSITGGQADSGEISTGSSAETEQMEGIVDRKRTAANELDLQLPAIRQ